MRIARRTAAVGAATALAAGSALFGMPGVAAADTVSTKCGGSVEAKVGDTVLADTSVLGLNLGTIDLGQVTAGTTVLSKTLDSLTGLVCRVTVTVTTAVDDTVDGAEKAVEDATGAELDGTTDPVKSATESARQAAGATPEDPQESGPGAGDGTNESPPGNGSGSAQKQKQSDPNPPSNSSAWGGSVPGFAAFPYASFPMSAFGSYPTASIGSADFSTAPGLRYGVDFGDLGTEYGTGYAPQFGLLGDSPRAESSSDAAVRNAGSADNLAPVTGNGIGLPMLLAVLALATASAGLVRVWVLRNATS